MDIKTLTDEQIDAAIAEISQQVDALKGQARVFTRERGNRGARAKLTASLESAGISAEAKASILGEFDAQVAAEST